MENQTIQELVRDSETGCICWSFATVEAQLFGWSYLFINNDRRAKLVFTDGTVIITKLSDIVMGLQIDKITTIAAAVSDSNSTVEIGDKMKIKKTIESLQNTESSPEEFGDHEIQECDNCGNACVGDPALYGSAHARFVCLHCGNVWLGDASAPTGVVDYEPTVTLDRSGWLIDTIEILGK